MRKRPTFLLARLRGFTAVLMVAAICIVSFSAVFARAAQASPAVHADVPAIAALSNAKTIAAKMCHRMVLPGAASACPLSSFSFGTVFGAADGLPRPPASVAVAWGLNDFPIPPQQPGLGLYRPPRVSA